MSFFSLYTIACASSLLLNVNNNNNNKSLQSTHHYCHSFIINEVIGDIIFRPGAVTDELRHIRIAYS